MKLLFLAFISFVMSYGSVLADGMSAHIGPQFENDKVVGFKFDNIAANSTWDKYGLKDGDVVLSINGAAASTFNTSTIDFVSALHAPKHVKLVVERNGEKKSFSFDNPKSDE